MDWANELPAEHFLPIDHTLHGAEKESPEVRASCTCTAAKRRRKAMAIRRIGMCRASRAPITIPTARIAALLWYHDHAMGINRLNIYAGLFGLHIIRDKVEDDLHLPGR